MPSLSPIVALDKILSNLVKQRQEHADAMAKIDVIFAKFGISPGKAQPTVAKPTPVAAVAPVRPAARKTRNRRKFNQTAEEFVLSLLNGKTLTSGQVNAKWAEVGRVGKADNTLSLLYKNNKVKRVPVKDGIGSNYSLI